MQAKRIYSGVMNELHFEFEHCLFDENNVPVTPMSFDFVTAKGSEFWASWKVKYVMTLNKHKKTYDFTKIRVQNINDDRNICDEDIAEVEVAVDTVNKNYSVIHEKFVPDNDLWAEENLYDFDVDASKESKIVVDVNFHHRNKSIGQMVKDFAEFWEDEDSCDVTFVVEGKEIKAHKQILAARNAVFAKMFKSDMKEKKDGRVAIKDAEYRIFFFFLKYLYLGKVKSKNVEDYKKLIVVADKYSMASLVELCETYLECKLTKDNVIDIFVVADLLSTDDLKQKCKDFMYNKREEVVETSGYKSLVDSKHADLLSELHCHILKHLGEENKRLNQVRTLK